MKEEYFDFDLYNIPETKSIEDFVLTADNVVVIYQEDYASHKELIHKIFSAAKLEFGTDINLLQLAKGESANLGKLITQKGVKVISFGIGQDKLGINAKFKAYRMYSTETFKILLSHSLKKLAESQEHKKALWTALQAHYLA